MSFGIYPDDTGRVFEPSRLYISECKPRQKRPLASLAQAPDGWINPGDQRASDGRTPAVEGLAAHATSGCPSTRYDPASINTSTCWPTYTGVSGCWKWKMIWSTRVSTRSALSPVNERLGTI